VFSEPQIESSTMSSSSEALYPPRPGNVGPLVHAVAVSLFAVLLVFNTLAIGVILALSTLLQIGRRLLCLIPGVPALGSGIAAFYHRQVQRLADRWLKDPRDEPILAAAITLGLTAYPVLLAQLWLKELSWPLLI